MKTNVMKQAWAIAREAAASFGGRAVEFFAEALREAWRLAKIVVPAMAGAMMVESSPRINALKKIEELQNGRERVKMDEFRDMMSVYADTNALRSDVENEFRERAAGRNIPDADAKIAAAITAAMPRIDAVSRIIAMYGKNETRVETMVQYRMMRDVQAIAGKSADITGSSSFMWDLASTTRSIGFIATLAAWYILRGNCNDAAKIESAMAIVKF